MHGNFIEASTTSTGTGDLTLSAVTGLKTPHAEFGTGQPFRYVVLDSSRLPLEAGIGLMSSSTNLQRKWVHEKITSGVWAKPNDASSFLSLAAGTKYVVCAPLAGGLVPTPGHSFVANSGTANNRLVQPDNYLSTSSTTISLVANTIYAWPVRIPHHGPYDGFVVRPGATGSNMDLALYRTLDSGLPGDLVVGVTGVASAVGTVIASFTSQALDPGWYIAAIGVSANVAVFSGVLMEGYSRSTTISQEPLLSKSYTAGTLPNPFGTPGSIGVLANVAAFFLRHA